MVHLTIQPIMCFFPPRSTMNLHSLKSQKPSRPLLFVRIYTFIRVNFFVFNPSTAEKKIKK